MSLTAADVRAIAHLARLELGPEDAEALVGDLGRILSLIEQMNVAATDALEPMAHPLELTQPLRADEVTESDERERFQSIAPAVAGGLYLVPRVIE